MLPAEQVSLRGLGLERRERWLFRRIDIEVPRGKFIAIVGPSGAGKTSLWHAWLARSNLRKVKSSSDVPRVVLTRHLLFAST